MERLEVPKTAITVLTCGLDREDIVALEIIFKPAAKFKFIHVTNAQDAMPFLLKLAAEVVVVERSLADGSWEQLLEATPRSIVVVVDRLADDAMWAEVLAAGGHELEGSQPLDMRKIERAIVAASYRWLHIYKS